MRLVLCSRRQLGYSVARRAPNTREGTAPFSLSANAVLILIGLFMISLSAYASTAPRVVASLPSPGRFNASVASDGATVFTFGGTNNSSYPAGRTDILQYTYSTNTVQTLSETLPYDVQSAPAVWAAGKYYLFGGLSTTSGAGAVACSGVTYVCAGDRDDILEYDPKTHVITTVAHLPGGRHGAVAVWTGQYVYVLGGVARNDIVRFNPATNEVLQMVAQLPSCRAHAAAVWDGTEVLLFGGYLGGCLAGDTAEIVRYDPASGNVRIAAAAFPGPIAGSSAVWDGRKAYIFGGGNTTNTATIWEYDPQGDNLRRAPVTLPSPRSATGAALARGSAFIVGGSSDNGDLTDIVMWNSTPCTRIVFIGVRGSGEPFTSDNLGMGNTVKRVFTEASATVPGLEPYGLPYDAIPVFPVEPFFLNWGNSVHAGELLLRAYIAQQIQECPGVSFLLAGYSQGATVVANVVQSIDSSTASHILGVGLLGEAQFNPASVVDEGTFNKHLGGFLGERPEFVPNFQDRTVSYCISGDFVCNYSAFNVSRCTLSAFCPHYRYSSFPSEQRSYASAVGRYLAQQYIDNASSH